MRGMCAGENKQSADGMGRRGQQKREEEQAEPPR
jgi:hypothetical protein